MTDFHENQDKYIDDYVLDRLQGAEREAFEEHYFECDSCFRKLQLREELKSFLQSSPDFVRQVRTEVVEQSWAREEKVPWYRTFRWRTALATAAVLAVVIPVGTIYMKNRDVHISTHTAFTDRPEVRQMMSITPPVYLEGTRSDSSREKEQFNQAMNLFNDKAYSDAAAILEPLHAAGADIEDLSFYLGTAYYFMDDPARAVPLLQLSFDQEPAEKHAWYLAHALVKNGQRDQAITLFESVIEFKGRYEQPAREKLDILREL